MSCETRLDAAVLADYWLGLVAESEAERLEEHLFGCEECSARLARVAEMAEGVRRLAREGSLLMVVSESFLKQAAEEGKRIRRYDPPKGGGVQCTVTAEDDLLIGGLAVDLREARRVDLSLCDPLGKEQMRLADIPFAAGAGSVLWQQSITFAKAAPNSTMVARLIDVGEAGEERVLGEYTFNHTRTLPGPGAW
ncbi:hypothetical protein DYQ86_01950 [Acidobacteria bacterium AB60]|nr:hypothetical protein DYQ86_01950 [Acidobacteria bacterium AB60]